MQQAALDVPEMHSRDCERAVTSVLINVPGVHWATAAAGSGVVAVGFDPDATDAAELQDVVATIGYAPTP